MDLPSRPSARSRGRRPLPLDGQRKHLRSTLTRPGRVRNDLAFLPWHRCIGLPHLRHSGLGSVPSSRPDSGFCAAASATSRLRTSPPPVRYRVWPPSHHRRAFLSRTPGYATAFGCRCTVSLPSRPMAGTPCPLPLDVRRWPVRPAPSPESTGKNDEVNKLGYTLMDLAETSAGIPETATAALRNALPEPAFRAVVAVRVSVRRSRAFGMASIRVTRSPHRQHGFPRPAAWPPFRRLTFPCLCARSPSCP